MTTSDRKAIRIQKILSQAGIASRRKAEGLIIQKRVRLNGQLAQIGDHADPKTDRIEVDGKKISDPARIQRVVFALYKPKNCVTTMEDPQGRTTVKEFFPKHVNSLFPVGRLDYDTEGLLFLTNDGAFAHQMLHPQYKIWKTYLVKLKGSISEETLRHIRQGVVIEGKTTLPLQVKVVNRVNDKVWLDVSLREGMNQQIKKMFFSVGHRVLKIKRYQIGFIGLEDLQPKESRQLEPQEITDLLSLATTGKPNGMMLSNP